MESAVIPDSESFCSWRRHVAVFFICLIILFSRRPDAVTHPQFWAEDGSIWYADAYNAGPGAPFLWQVVGYFQTFPRLAALMAQALPLWLAPYLFNSLAILIQILPVMFLLSTRLSHLGSYRARAFMAFLYLALPNMNQLHANVTNAQWILALLALLILFARAGAGFSWSVFDYSMLALSAATGPFVILIAPIAVLLLLIEGRSKWRVSLVAITGIGAIVQLLSLLSAEARANEAQALTPLVLVQILAKQVFLPVLFGRRTLGPHSFDSGWGLGVAIAATVIGVAIEAYVFWKAPVIWKMFLLFATGLLAVSLAFPAAPATGWPAILVSSGGIRYWFFPMLAFVVSVVWMLKTTNPMAIRRAATLLIVAMFYGIIQDWGHPRFSNLDFTSKANTFSELPAGTHFVIPLNPTGWSMELVKR